MPVDFILRAIKYIGVAARIDVTSKDSKCRTTSLRASSPSWIVKMTSWWTVPMYAATVRACAKSGESSSPTENECSLGHQASSVSPDYTRFNRCRAAIAAIKDESNPPEISTPKGTSHL